MVASTISNYAKMAASSLVSSGFLEATPKKRLMKGIL
jgi:hypothetical protein